MFLLPLAFPNKLELEVLLDQLSPELRRKVIFSTFFSSCLTCFKSSLGDFSLAFLVDVESAVFKSLFALSPVPTSDDDRLFFFLSFPALFEGNDLIFNLTSFISSSLSLFSFPGSGSSKGIKPTGLFFGVPSSVFFFFFFTVGCDGRSSAPDVLEDLFSPGVVTVSCILTVLLPTVTPSCLCFLTLSGSCEEVACFCVLLVSLMLFVSLPAFVSMLCGCDVPFPGEEALKEQQKIINLLQF